MTSLAARIAGFPKAQPFVFNLGVAAAKTSAADDRDAIRAARLARFG